MVVLLLLPAVLSQQMKRQIGIQNAGGNLVKSHPSQSFEKATIVLKQPMKRFGKTKLRLQTKAWLHHYDKQQPTGKDLQTQNRTLWTQDTYNE